MLNTPCSKQPVDADEILEDGRFFIRRVKLSRNVKLFSTTKVNAKNFNIFPGSRESAKQVKKHMEAFYLLHCSNDP